MGYNHLDFLLNLPINTSFFNHLPFFFMRNENTFGTRLENARALVGLFAGMPAYSAHVPELDPTAFAQLLADAEQAQRSFADLQNQLAVLRNKRKKIMQGDELTLGIMANLRNIRAAVTATFGKKSLELEKTTELTNKIRGYRPTKLTELDPTTNEVVETGSISRSNASYGSVSHTFATLVQLLASFGARYQPTATHLQINVLQNISNELSAENTNTQVALANSSIQKNKRDEAFQVLSQRFLLIKAHILASFGAKSAEYKNIKRLSV